MPDFLPYGAHSLEDDDIAAVVEALKQPLLTGGAEVSAFETDFAAATKAPEAVVVNSGTAALHLACLGSGLGPGDCAIVPTVTFLSTANAVRMCGADVVFCDVDPDSGLMTPETLSQALERMAPHQRTKLKAVLPVHLNGHLVDLEGVISALGELECQILVDGCHALGGAYGDQSPVGSSAFGEITTFSLHPVKTIAMGEGGMITLSDPAQAENLRRLRSHDMTRISAEWKHAPSEPAPWYYEAHSLGYNYRAPDILCALGRSQLKKLSIFHQRRCDLAERYTETFAGSTIVGPVKRGQGTPGWHLYPVLIDFVGLGISRSAAMSALVEQGVGTQVHYIPVHSQPYYEGLYGRQSFPGAQAYYRQVLSLPLFPGMRDSDPARVAAALATVLSP